MKLPVRIITGFLEAGKTSYIHHLLADSDTSRRILILSFEEGIEEYEIEERHKHNVRIQFMDTLEELDEGFLRNCSYLYDEMIMEYSGIWMMSDLLDRMSDGVHIQEIICLLDGTAYERYLPNIPAVSDQLMNCDRVMMTHLDEKESARVVKQALSPLRLRSEMQWLNREGNCSPIGWTRIQKRTASISVFFLLLLAVSLGGYPSVSSADVLIFFRMFFSIILEVLPFLLTGILVSSLIQVFVSEEFFLRLLKLPRWAFVPVLLVSGCLLPLCDCAMVPLSEKLIQKGLPVSLGVMFLCISSSINPIILLSTYYAFPQQPELIVFRLAGSILISLVMGLLFHHLQRADVLKQRSSLLEDRRVYETRNLKRTGSNGSLVFQNMGEEVLRIMMYVLIGALLSAMVQLMARSGGVASFLQDPGLAMISMLGASFLLSICATSNAFVAKAFANSVSLANAAAFMLFGPLLDGKNLLMLSSRFQRCFVVRYVLMLVILYALLSGLAMLVLS